MIFIECATRYQAEWLAPWAVIICKCEGGFAAFRSIQSYRTWKRQK